MQDDELSKAAAAMGRKGGAATGPSKRRAVDYSALGKKGGRPSAREKLPCQVCTTPTSYRSHYQVLGGVRVKVKTRPVCLTCDRQARVYPIKKKV